MAERPPAASIDFSAGPIDLALDFLKRTRSELRSLRKAHVWNDRFQVFDVNGDYFEIRGVGYLDEQIVPILRAVNAAFKPESIHDPIDGPFKEFQTGRRHPWAEDRVM